MMTRREFLQTATRWLIGLGGVLSAAGLARFLSFTPPPPPPKRYPVGLETDFLPNSRTVLPEIPALLIREHSEFRAIGLVCTHLGCTVEYHTESFECACHGSRFGKRGEVVRGPAVSALKELKVERNIDGQLVVIVES